MKRTKLTAVCLAGALAVTSLTGCGVGDNKVVATMEDQKVTYGLVNFMCRYQQAYSDEIYRSVFGDSVWKTDMYQNGSTMEDNVKNNVMTTLHEMLTVEAHADEYNVSLTDEELQKIDDVTDEFLAANSKDTLDEMGANADVVKEFLRLSTLRNKVYTEIIKDADTDVSDEEANVKDFTMVQVDTKGYYDENNSYVTYTEEESSARVSTAEAIAAAVADPADLESVAEEFGYTANASTYKADDTSLPDEVKEELDKLTENTMSGAIVTDSAVYIVRMDSLHDEEATEENRQSIIATRKSTYYNDTLTKWQEDDGWKVKEKMLASISFDNYFTSASDTEGTESVESTQQ